MMDRQQIAKQLRAEAQRLMDEALHQASPLIKAAEALEGKSINVLASLAVSQAVATSLRGNTCKEKIEDLLRKRGPLPRAEILKTSGLNPNTVGFTLTTKNFNRDDSGRWSPKIKV